MSCPACDSRRIRINETVNGIAHMKVCRDCNAIFGQCYLGDSYAIAKPYLKTEGDTENERYFDLTCLGSQGITRRHGWINAAGELTQIG